MGLEKIDEVLSDMSEGILALVSGIAIIITITFIIYEVGPLLDDKSGIFAFSLISLLVCVVSSISFYLSDITLLPDVGGKLITGLTLALFGVILFHVGNTYGASELPVVILTGSLGFASSLPLVKGVLIPVFGDEAYLDTEEDESFETDFETGLEEDIEEDVEKDVEKPVERSFEEDEGPW